MKRMQSRLKSPDVLFLEHSNPLYVTSSFVFEDAEDMRASFDEENPIISTLLPKKCFN